MLLLINQPLSTGTVWHESCLNHCERATAVEGPAFRSADSTPIDAGRQSAESLKNGEVSSRYPDGLKLVNPANQLPWRIKMNDTPIEPMSAENVEEFDVWIFESRDLVVSIIPHQIPWKLATEEYEIIQY
jgi:hypothetical protein